VAILLAFSNIKRFSSGNRYIQNVSRKSLKVCYKNLILNWNEKKNGT